jgi:hypothetical protein
MWRQRAPAGSSLKWVMEVMGGEQVKAIAIDRFCERPWMDPTIIQLQRVMPLHTLVSSGAHAS